MLTREDLTPLVIESKGSEVAEFIENSKGTRPDASALATQASAKVIALEKRLDKLETENKATATALATERREKNQLQNTLNQKNTAAERAAAKKREREAAGAGGGGPDNKRQKGDGTFYCSFCGGANHAQRDCTAPGSEEKRKEVAAERAAKGGGKGGKDTKPWWKLTKEKKHAMKK
jgi:hypothetical protein